MQAYLEYWGLDSPAFQTSLAYDRLFMPDSWMSKMDRMLLFSEQAPSLMTLTTSPGHCKSTMARWLYKSLSPDTHEVLLVSLYQEEFDAGWLLPKLCRFLGIQGTDRLQSLEHLAQAIEESNLDSRVLTVIIDEAHKLKSPSSMQEIHSLISMQSLVPFGINFVLLGNPQMMDVVGQTQEFHNRLSLSVHLENLSLEELVGYISYRLQMNRIPANTILPDTIEMIHQISQGVYSRINALLENSLIEAFLKSEKTINSRIVDQASQFLPSHQESQYRPARQSPSRSEPPKRPPEAPNKASRRVKKESKPSKSVEISSLFYKADKK
ncbi:ExeA family protein [Pseudobacteriovorax antillogorgiicola]|nr:AAA family ATPase [Pseudobacteriovorax antillogorgiicola]